MKKHRRFLIQCMRISLLHSLITCFCISVSWASDVSAQELLDRRITIDVHDQKVKIVLVRLEKAANVKFSYSPQVVQTNRKLTFQVENITLGEVLSQLLPTLNLTYNVVGSQIILRPIAQSDPETIKVEPSQSTLPDDADKPADQVVSGTVTDEKGSGLPGVSIVIKGKTVGTTTDSKGKYSLSVPGNETNTTVFFSFVGYNPQEIVIGTRTTIDVMLLPGEQLLSDVVVVGYSTQSRHKLTSAVATVSGVELNKRVATSPSTLLQGQLPGLQVTQGSAEPGNEGTELLIRGLGTFSGAGSNPLVIVDGIPGSLEVLNPNDIESVSVLKDAASAAIYGSRGANGVIVVRTKKGKSGDFSIQYNYNVGINKATKLPERITNSAEYMALYNEARLNSNFTPIYTQDQIDQYRNATDPIKYPNHDGLADLFQTAFTQNHYLNMSGGRDGNSYSVGFGATNQPGLFKGNDYKKYTLSLVLSSKVSKRITFGTNIQMRYGDKTNPPQGSGDQFLSALTQTPLYLPYLPDGRYTSRAYQLEGPNKNYVALLNENIKARTQNYYMQGNLSLDVDIIDGLKWENRGGINYQNTNFKSFIPSAIPLYYYSDGTFARNLDVGSPGLSTSKSDNIYYTIYSQFSYHKTVGQHTVSTFIGAQEEDNKASSLGASRLQFTTNYLQEINAGPVEGQSNSGTSSEWAIRSLYGNLNYDFKDKYLFGVSIRRDGTSRLPSNTRYGVFYSFSGGWRISQENFLKDVSWINDLKIRGSWGQLGNQNIGNYPYQSVFNGANYAFNNSLSSGFVSNQLVDPTLKWETTRVADIGIDLTVFNSKLTFTADYFNKYTFDILRGSQIPLYIGLSAPTINNGALRNKGLEVALQYNNKIGKDISYTIGGNVQGYKNILEQFGKTEISDRSIREEGHELDQYYLYIWDGIFQSQEEIDRSPQQPIKASPGDLKIKDVNGDGKIDPNDRTYVSGRYPKFTYSGNISASYKQFDLSAQIFGSYGRTIYVNGIGIEPFEGGTPPTTNWRNRWTPTNPSTTMPKVYTGYQPVRFYASTYFLQSASFARLKNLQLGYTVSKKLLGKIGIKSARLFFTGDNLLTVSEYPGLDPERVGDGFYSVYPQARTYTFGASAQF